MSGQMSFINLPDKTANAPHYTFSFIEGMLSVCWMANSLSHSSFYHISQQFNK